MGSRADLMVRGPGPYAVLEGLPGAQVRQVIYTSSGMAAVSALLMALGRIGGNLTLLLVLGSYKETLEVITAYGHHMRVEDRTGARLIRRVGAAISRFS